MTQDWKTPLNSMLFFHSLHKAHFFRYIWEEFLWGHTHKGQHHLRIMSSAPIRLSPSEPLVFPKLSLWFPPIDSINFHQSHIHCFIVSLVSLIASWRAKIAPWQLLQRCHGRHQIAGNLLLLALWGALWFSYTAVSFCLFMVLVLWFGIQRSLLQGLCSCHHGDTRHKYDTMLSIIGANLAESKGHSTILMLWLMHPLKSHQLCIYIAQCPFSIRIWQKLD